MRLLWSGTALDRLRLWTGLVLFAFVATHLLNHAVGLWSLEAMTTVQHWRLAVTRSPPGFVVLTASLLAHAGLALWKLARLRTLRLRRAEVLQGLSGFVIPYPADAASVRGWRRPALAGRRSGVSRDPASALAGKV